MFDNIVINDSIFLVDKNATFNYKTRYNEPCSCLYCQNYFQAIQNCNLVLQLLNEFHIDVSRPEECMCLETDFNTKTLDYMAWYSICGKATCKETITVTDKAKAEIYPPIENDDSPNTDHVESYFWLSLEIVLPWMLDEDINQLRVPEKTSIFKKLRSVFKHSK